MKPERGASGQHIIMFNNPTIGEKKWYSDLHDAFECHSDVTFCLTLKKPAFDRECRPRKYLYASFGSEKEAEIWEKKNSRYGKLTRVFLASCHDNHTTYFPQECFFDLEE